MDKVSLNQIKQEERSDYLINSMKNTLQTFLSMLNDDNLSKIQKLERIDMLNDTINIHMNMLRAFCEDFDGIGFWSLTQKLRSNSLMNYNMKPVSFNTSAFNGFSMEMNATNFELEGLDNKEDLYFDYENIIEEDDDDEESLDFIFDD